MKEEEDNENEELREKNVLVDEKGEFSKKSLR
jgi:hypothetical protein